VYLYLFAYLYARETKGSALSAANGFSTKEAKGRKRE